MVTQRDIAGKAHWDDNWSGDQLPLAIDAAGGRVRDYAMRRLQRLYDQVLDECDVGPGATFLEVGCGGSVWMPYFASHRALRVSGVDYSTNGCDLSRRIMARSHLSADVHQCDLFAPPRELLGAFDVVFSNGVIEHFKDTAGCVSAIAGFAKPGGIVISMVPNMAGLAGTLQRVFDRSTYDIHVPLTLQQLAGAHEAAGLHLVRGEYVLFLNTGVVALKQPGGALTTLAKRVALAVAARVSMAAWVVDGPNGRLPTNGWTSPYVLCVARTPTDAAT